VLPVHYVTSSVFEMVTKETEVVKVACTLGWELLVLCGYWNEWLHKCYYKQIG